MSSPDAFSRTSLQSTLGAKSTDYSPPQLQVARTRYGTARTLWAANRPQNSSARPTAHDLLCSPPRTRRPPCSSVACAFRHRLSAAPRLRGFLALTLCYVLRHDPVAAIPCHTPALWDGLQSRVPQRGGAVSAEPRTISHASGVRVTGLLENLRSKNLRPPTYATRPMQWLGVV